MEVVSIQNVSEPTSYSTIFVEDYIDNSTENISETPIIEQTSRSVNVNGILWPALFAALIIFANFLSLLAFCVNKRLRTYNNYFIINLSILDFIIGLLQIPVVFHTHLGYYPFSQVICKATTGLKLGLINASNLTVVVICADRHRATYDPINHFMSRSKRQAIMKSSVAWIVSLVFWYLYTTTPEFIIDFDNGRHCVRWYRLYPFPGMVPYITLFYLPFIVIAVLYFRIVSKIRATLGGKNVERQFDMKDANNGKIGEEFSQDDMTSAVSTATINTELSSDNNGLDLKVKNDVTNVENAKKTTRKRESANEMRKATRTLLFIVIAFVVSWLPQSIISLIYSIEPVLVVPGLPRPGRLFFGWMAYLNSFLNPISYAVSQPLFRSTIINMFLCRRKG